MTPLTALVDGLTAAAALPDEAAWAPAPGDGG